MNIILCLDDNNGMAFNHRRQSKDSVVRKKIIETVKDSVLHTSEYTARQFEEDIDLCISEDYISQTACGEFCFIETEDPLPYLESAEKFIIFRWNRIYPSDVKCSITFDSFNLISSEEFEGTSHKNIVMEVFSV